MRKLILILFLISTSYVFAQSKLPRCQGSDLIKYNNCFGEHEIHYGYTGGVYKLDKYVGEFKEGEYHGKGTFTWTSGYKYVGEYREGKKHGQGTFSDVNGMYKGTWKDGTFVGK
jgi:hypothetical protein